MRLTVFALCFAASAASAQTIYTWTDADGTVNYSDTLSGVPQGAKVDTTKGEEFALINVEDGEKKEGEAVARPAAVTPPPVYRAEGSGYTSAIDGRPLDEYQWRSRFRVALADVQNLEDEMAIDKRRYEDPASSGYGPGYLCGGGVPVGGGPQPYRAQSQIGSMQARATIPPAGGVNVVPTGNGGAVLVNGAPQPQHLPQQGGRHNNGYYSGGTTWGGCVATPSADYERLKERIERNTLALKRAKEALGDLEREASHHGVPREWRKG